MKIKVFVYGTLLNGMINHRRMEVGNAKFIGSARTANKYLMTAGSERKGFGIPYVNPIIRNSFIKGEVYEVNLRLLKNLDRLEGHPNFYFRKKINIVMDKGNKVIQAWIYFCEKHFGDDVVYDGDFYNYITRGGN